MKDEDTHEHYGTNYARLNDFQIQRMSPAIQDFSYRYHITKRESEILILIAVHGFSNREIAEQCVITEKTVKNHLANIMDKIGIRSMRKLLSVLFSHVLYYHENQSAKVISLHAMGQIFEEKVIILSDK
jgi:DNA-binding NarL/FixJ family response regulator